MDEHSESTIETLDTGEIISLNPRIPEGLSAQSELDAFIRFIGSLEEDGSLGIGDNDIYFRLPTGNVRNPKEIRINPNGQLSHVGTEGTTDIEAGDFLISPGLNECQAVFVETTNGILTFQHNFYWGHFDVPSLIVKRAMENAGLARAQIRKILIMARDHNNITQVVNPIMKLNHVPASIFEIWKLPELDESGTLARIWGHVDRNGNCSYKVSEDNSENVEVKAEVGSFS